MAKMDYEKLNRKKSRPSTKESERWGEIKNTFKKATDAQKRLIRKYNMYAHHLVSDLSKQAAYNIISKYAKEHGWKKK